MSHTSELVLTYSVMGIFLKNAIAFGEGEGLRNFSAKGLRA
jgi:hypothetical protein